ncbi:MFS transporter [Candidatus Poriferisodalis sp.]|uniref:MFS transporter n=1 Tax=Candidatus Poriferisodalis sp. TaxID=3101277 RepID=UPI003B01C6A7
MKEERATTAPDGQARIFGGRVGALSVPESPGRVATFAALGVPAFRLLWLSGVFSFMSIQMQFLLRSLLAWDLTESEGALGIVMFSFGAALGISTLFGGVAADRLSKRRLMLFGQMVLLLGSVGMGLALAADVIAFWMLLVSSALQGLMFGLIGPARISMTTELVGRERLGNAITLSSLSLSGSRVIAPTGAGLLAGWALFGLAGAYFVSAAIATLSYVLLVPLPETSKQDDTPDGAARAVRLAIGNPLAEIRQGVRYVTNRPELRRPIVTSIVVIMFGFSYVAFQPALVEGVFGLGDRQVGFIAGASSIGAVVASIVLASRADSPSADSIMTGLGFAFGVSVMALAWAPSYEIALVVTAVIGAASIGFISLTQATVMRATDEAYQGRVQSLVQLPFAAFAIAAAPLGVLAEWTGVRAMFLTMGIAVTLSMTAYSMSNVNSGRTRQPTSPP